MVLTDSGAQGEILRLALKPVGDSLSGVHMYSLRLASAYRWGHKGEALAILLPLPG